MKKTSIFLSALALSLLMASTVFAETTASNNNGETYTMMGRTFTQAEYDKMRSYMVNNDFEGMNQFMINNFGFSMRNGGNGINCITNNNTTNTNSNSTSFSKSGRGCH